MSPGLTRDAEKGATRSCHRGNGLSCRGSENQPAGFCPVTRFMISVASSSLDLLLLRGQPADILVLQSVCGDLMPIGDQRPESDQHDLRDDPPARRTSPGYRSDLARRATGPTRHARRNTRLDASRSGARIPSGPRATLRSTTTVTQQRLPSGQRTSIIRAGRFRPRSCSLASRASGRLLAHAARGGK